MAQAVRNVNPLYGIAARLRPVLRVAPELMPHGEALVLHVGGRRFTASIAPGFLELYGGGMPCRAIGLGEDPLAMSSQDIVNIISRAQQVAYDNNGLLPDDSDEDDDQ